MEVDQLIKQVENLSLLVNYHEAMEELSRNFDSRTEESLLENVQLLAISLYEEFQSGTWQAGSEDRYVQKLYDILLRYGKTIDEISKTAEYKNRG